MKLIDADALLKTLGMAEECGKCQNSRNALFCALSSEMVDVCEAITDLPTVDAVPVVRCKDCKRCEDEELGLVYCHGFVGGWVSNDFFCAHGERRTDG